MNLKVYLLENRKSENWMQRCNTLFIIKDFKNFERLDYLKKFVKIYKCVDTHHMKTEEIADLLKTKTNITHFIIDYNSNIKDIIYAKRKTHFMPIQLDFSDEKFMNFSSLLNPNFTGWFWNNFYQKKLHYYRRKSLKQILKIDQVKDQLKKFNELETFWVKQSTRLHVTALYIGPDADKSKTYLEKVDKEFGSPIKAKVTGILLTPRNISGHVEITENVKWMFDPDEQNEFDLKIHVTLATSKIGKPVDSGPDQVDVQTMIKDKKTPVQEFELEIGKLQDWGECRFYIVLKRALNYELMFLPFCK